MFWKIYFWFFIVLLVCSYAISGIREIWGVVDLLISSFALVGFFLFAYRKFFLTSRFWKVYVFIFIIWDFVYNLLIVPKVKGKFEPFSLVGLIFVIPIYIALYLYAFRFLKQFKPNTSATTKI